MTIIRVGELQTSHKARANEILLAKQAWWKGREGSDSVEYAGRMIHPSIAGLLVDLMEQALELTLMDEISARDDGPKEYAEIKALAKRRIDELYAQIIDDEPCLRPPSRRRD